MKNTFCTLLAVLFGFAIQPLFGIAPQQNPVVVFETTQGNIELTLYPNQAPKTCENFIELVNSGYYNGTTFHRVIKNFMIQGGDPQGNGTGGQSIWGKPFQDEFSPILTFNRPGLLAMANRGPNTNGSQFFITTAPTPWLNNKHTIFGEVSEGYNTVKKIEATPTGAMDKPLTPQVITKAYMKS
ncbi:MAG: peptidylprolyl isomerase [Parachlamydiales bacterium]|nr:peptidylprolyl isomerase [Parachlamydiales bacterium]